MRRGLAILASLVALAALPAPALAAQPGPDRGWLVLGDSYTSGEGIEGTPAGHSDFLGQNCRRATGDGMKQTAWAAGAYQRLREEKGFAELSFVACTGNISDNAERQIEEAQSTSGRRTWDLVTFSFGGNNIRFADVIMGCILPKKNSWTDFDFGCKVTEDQLRRRIDMLAGKAPIDPAEFAGSMPLPQLYDLVARYVAPGGDVLVAGYPNLIEDVGRWSRWRRKLGNCSGVQAKDVPLLRNVGGYLNQRIAQAVADADRRHREDGVRFHFVDIAKNPYELDGDPHNRHARCTDEPWLNGIVYDGHQPGAWNYKNRSFHPNQDGHTNTARVVAAYIRENVTFSDTGTRTSQPVSAEHYRQDSFYFFTSADGRYMCGIAADQALCQGETHPVPPRPASCREGWGNGMLVDPNGKTDFLCAGGLVYGPIDRNPDDRDVLPPGRSIKAFGFTCAAEEDNAIRCTHNGSGHGFAIAGTSNERF
jgi:GDSL-like lipase/acylhydrolase family protein